MKLCLIAPVPPPYGGIANWYLLLSNYIECKARDITVSTINIAPRKRATEGRCLWNRIVVSGIEMLMKKKEMNTLLKMDCPDVIHMTTSGQLAIIRDVLLLKTARRHHVPTVYHIRFGRVPEISRQSTIEWKIMKMALRLASSVIAIDQETKAAIDFHLPMVKTRYIPNPFDLEKNQQIVSDKKKKEVVFAGWVVKTKGIEELLVAWERVRVKYSDFLLKIVGPFHDKYFSFLQEKYSFENVLFTGELDHDSTLKTISEGEIFILPSYTEGFPNSILEAMACGKPVIATSVGAIPDMLRGECGVVIQPQKAAEIENALDVLLGNEEMRERMGTNAKLKVMEKYAIDVVFEQYYSLWGSRCIEDDSHDI